MRRTGRGSWPVVALDCWSTPERGGGVARQGGWALVVWLEYPREGEWVVDWPSEKESENVSNCHTISCHTSGHPILKSLLDGDP